MTPPPDERRSPHQKRLDRLRDALREAGVHGLLVSHLPNVRYLSGFSGSSGLLLVQPDAATLITDFRYEQQAVEEVDPAVGVRITRDGLIAELAAQLERGGGGRVLGFEAERVTVQERREIGEKCDRSVWEPAPPILEEMRAQKDADELAQIARAAGIAARAFEETIALVREGMNEREVAAELDYRLRVAGSESPPFESIVASGPRSALPHARPSDRRLAEGDLLLCDFGARVDGYCSDMTRTAVLGPPAPWQCEIHEAVRGAVEAALARLEVGRPARAVDQAAREALDAAGLLEHFGHSTGHGLGLEVHEAPRLHRTSEELLRPGNVVTVEPGVYLAGRGGVRIEEDVVVQDAVPRVLTLVPRTLLEL
ncbi:MAG: M24 family metallopeptidase [Gemmatimonadota bacterium]